MSTEAEAFADDLHQARLAGQTVDPLTTRWPGMTTQDAYDVQAAGIRRRVQDGEQIIGGKLGFTSAAMRRAMGVDSPNYGWLTDSMLLAADSRDTDLRHHGLIHHGLIHPKAEPEIAFRLGSDLVAPVTAADVLRATESVMACLELVDSRFTDFRFGPLDNIADNSSAGKLVLGEPVDVSGIDLRLVGVVVEVDGVVHDTAAGAAAHDDPAAAVAWMVNHCGQPLTAGMVVISGGLTAPVTLSDTQTVTAHFDRLGPVSLPSV